MPENSGPIQGKGRFKPGKSGNPGGKPKGARNKVTRAIELLLEGEADAIARACVEKAKAGDGLALRLCMERLAPVRRGRPVRITLPTMQRPEDLPMGLSAVLAAVAQGELTPEEGQAIAAVFETTRSAIETVDHDRRLQVLEAKTNHR